MNTDQFAVVSSMYTLGGFLGALAAGPLCNKLGRLLTMRLTTIFFIIGPVFESAAPNIGLLAFGRVLSGLGAGAAVVVVPIYISEIAPPKEKGLFGALTQIMVNVGIVTAQLLGYFLSKDGLWRIILAVAGGIGVFQLLALSLVPESPKWLAEHRNPQDARRILRKLRGHKADLDEEVKAWNVDSSREDICAYILIYLLHLTANMSQRKKNPCSARHLPHTHLQVLMLHQTQWAYSAPSCTRTTDLHL